MRYVMILLSLLALEACQDSKFKGYTGGGKANDNPPASTPPPGTNGSNPGTGTPGTTIPGGNGTSTPGNGIGLEFANLVLPWHLGDASILNLNGGMDASTCKTRLSIKFAKPAFNFNFYVERDGTQVSISVKHCGVGGQDDNGNQVYAYQNPVVLLGPSQNANAAGPEIDRMILPVTNNALVMTEAKFNRGVFTLNQGWYKIRVSSDRNPANNDLDDFLIGGVALIAPTGPMRLGDVTTN